MTRRTCSSPRTWCLSSGPRRSTPTSRVHSTTCPRPSRPRTSPSTSPRSRWTRRTRRRSRRSSSTPTTSADAPPACAWAARSVQKRGCVQPLLLEALLVGEEQAEPRVELGELLGVRGVLRQRRVQGGFLLGQLGQLAVDPCDGLAGLPLLGRGHH